MLQKKISHMMQGKYLCFREWDGKWEQWNRQNGRSVSGKVVNSLQFLSISCRKAVDKNGLVI
jgi:hypothetical protein